MKNELAEKIVASFLEPVLILIIFQINSLGRIIAIIWFCGNVLILFRDRETLVITLVKSLLGLD